MKTLKKLLSLVCAAAIVLSCVSFPLPVTAGAMNVALSAAAYDNLNGTNQGGAGSHGPQAAIDGDQKTRWNGPTTHASGDIPGTTVGEWDIWLLWDEAQNVDQIKINWEVCHGRKFTVVGSTDGENWDVPIKDEQNNNGGGWYTINLDATLSLRGVRVNITEKANTWGVAIWELEVYDLHANVYDTIPLESAVALADKTFGGTDNVYGYTGETWAAYLSAREAAVTAAGSCKGKPVGSVAGFADQDAVDAAAFALKKAVFSLEYDVGPAGDSLLYNGFFAYDQSNLSSYCSGHNYRSLTDGSWENDNNNYQPDSNNSKGATVYIKPAADSITFNVFQFYGESSGYDFTVFYTADDMSDAYDTDTFFAHNWRLLANSGSAEVTDLGNSTKLYDFSFNTATATAICIVYNGGGWYKIREVQAAFDENRPDGPDTPDTPVYPPMPEDTYVPPEAPGPVTAPVTLFFADLENGDDAGMYPTGNSSALIDGYVAHESSYSYKIYNRDQTWNSSEWSMGGRMSPGNTYRFSAWVYHEGKAPVLFQLSFKINNGESYTYCVMQKVEPKKWTYVIGQYTVGDGEYSVNPYIEQRTDTSAFWIDDITIEQTGGYVADSSIETDIVSLKNVFAGTGVTVGASIGTRTLSDKNQLELIKKHFDSVAIENQLKAQYILDYSTSVSDLSKYNEAPALDFTAATPLFEFAKENGLTVSAQALVWYQMTPEWFFREDYDTKKPLVSRELMLKRLESYIKGVLTWCETNYPGIATTWIVVNEAVSDGTPGVRNDNFYKTIGEDYIAKTFEFANKYRPASGCSYLYNDYNIEGYAEKLDYALDYLANCGAIENGWVDGIGFQCHIAMDWPNVETLKKHLAKVAALGLECEITEIDVRFGDSDIAKYDSEYAAHNALRERYKAVIGAFMAAKAAGLELKNITWWGLTDEYTWLTSQHNEPQYPLLFDAHNKAKPAFWGVVEAIRPELTALDNLALNKETGESGHQGASVASGCAVDGDIYTRWVSQKTGGEYLLWVKLGDEPVSFNNVKIRWDFCFAKDFRLQIKDSEPDVNTGWTDITDALSGVNGAQDILLGDTVRAKYVRMYATQKSAESGCSISEFEVFLAPGPTVSQQVYIGEDTEEFPNLVGLPYEDGEPDADTNPNLAVLRYAASESTGDYSEEKNAAAAFDADESTLWQAEHRGSASLTLTLDGVCTLRSAVIKWGGITSDGTGRIEVSDDGENWITVAENVGDPALQNKEEVAVFDAVNAKYVRFTSTNSDYNDANKSFAPEIREFELYEFDPTQMRVSAVAAQQKTETDGSRTIRLIAAVKSGFEGNVSVDFDAVGFKISAAYPDGGYSHAVLSDTTVYGAIETSGVTLTGADFGIQDGKLFMLTVKNVPDDAAFYVRAFAVNKDGDKVNGNFNAYTLVSLADGELYVE